MNKKVAMKEFKIETIVECYDYNELSEEYRSLVDSAKQQTQTAYAPYSNFYVGAAVLLDNGEIVTGSNQENAAYPSGICAERTTLFYAGAQYPKQKIKALAIAAFHNGDFLQVPISPCGACRQVILEYEQRSKQPMDILLYGKQGVYRLKGVKALLPFSFVSETMGVHI